MTSMPRAKANPDPLTVEYQRKREPVATFVLQAWRDGHFRVLYEGKVISQGPPVVNNGLGAPKWPSNSIQAQAMDTAKAAAELARLPAKG